VCGRKFPEGQGVYVNIGDIRYIFHSKRCAIKFFKRFIEELDPSLAKGAAERVAKVFEDELKEKMEVKKKRI
jgi:hypothetical protein